MCHTLWKTNLLYAQHICLSQKKKVARICTRKAMRTADHWARESLDGDYETHGSQDPITIALAELLTSRSTDCSVMRRSWVVLITSSDNISDILTVGTANSPSYCKVYEIEGSSSRRTKTGASTSSLSTTFMRNPTCLPASAHCSFFSYSSSSASLDILEVDLNALERSESQGRKTRMMPSPIVTQLLNSPLFGPTFTRLVMTQSCEKSSWDSRCIFWQTNSASRSIRLFDGPGAHPPAGWGRSAFRSSSGCRGRKWEYSPESSPSLPAFSVPS